MMTKRFLMCALTSALVTSSMFAINLPGAQNKQLPMDQGELRHMLMQQEAERRVEALKSKLMDTSTAALEQELATKLNTIITNATSDRNPDNDIATFTDTLKKLHKAYTSKTGIESKEALELLAILSMDGMATSAAEVGQKIDPTKLSMHQRKMMILTMMKLDHRGQEALLELADERDMEPEE